MKVRNLKQSGMLLLAGIFLLGSILGCEDNKRNSRYGYRGLGMGAAAYGTTSYTNYSRGALGYTGTDRSSVSSLGWDRGTLSTGRSGGLITDGSRVLSTGGSRGVISAGDSQRGGRLFGGSSVSAMGSGRRATKTFPYVIDESNLWETTCNGGSYTADTDAICDEYETSPAAAGTALHKDGFNGLVVKGATFSGGKKFQEMIGKQSGSFIEKLRKALNGEIAGFETIGPINEGLVTASWSAQVTNWNTKVKDSIINGSQPFPFIEDAGLASVSKGNELITNNGDVSASSLAGLSGDANIFFGGNDTPRDNLLDCAQGWFRQGFSAGSTFKIMNAGEAADDGVFVMVDGGIKAYSVRDNTLDIFSKLWKDNVTGKDVKNSLSFDITDNKYHVMDFCYYNEKGGKGQGEVRIMRNKNAKEYGFEPLSAIDFRVVAPSDLENREARKASEIITVDREQTYWAEKDNGIRKESNSGTPGAGQPGSGGTGNGGQGNGTHQPKSVEEILKTLLDALKLENPDQDPAGLAKLIALMTAETSDPDALALMDQVINKLLERYNNSVSNANAQDTAKIAELDAAIAKLKEAIAGRKTKEIVIVGNGETVTIPAPNGGGNYYATEVFSFVGDNTDGCGGMTEYQHVDNVPLEMKFQRIAAAIKAGGDKIVFYGFQDGGSTQANTAMRTKRIKCIMDKVKVALETDASTLDKLTVPSDTVKNEVVRGKIPSIRHIIVTVDKAK